MPIAPNHTQSVLITGATGFIGQHLVDALLKRQWQVTALVLPGESTPVHWLGRVNILTGDIRTLTSLEPQLEAIDTLFHLAAIVSDWGAQAEHVDITVRGTEQAITLALKKQAQLIVTTSIAVYASNLGQGHITEETPHGKPSSAYETCKQEQEKVTLDAVKRRQLKATLIRPSNVYGIGSKPWVERLAASIKQGSPVLLGKGDWDAGLCHVDNLIELMILAATKPHPNGQIYHGTDGFGISWAQYISELSRALALPQARQLPRLIARLAAPTLDFLGRLTRQNQPPPITRLAYRLMANDSIFSTEKARQELGYAPITSFEQGMQQLAHAGPHTTKGERL